MKRFILTFFLIALIVLSVVPASAHIPASASERFVSQAIPSFDDRFERDLGVQYPSIELTLSDRISTRIPRRFADSPHRRLVPKGHVPGIHISWVICHNNPVMYTDPTGKAPFVGGQMDMGYNSPTQPIGSESDYVSRKNRNRVSQSGHVIFTWEGGIEGNLFFAEGSLGYMLFFDLNAEPWYDYVGLGIYSKEAISLNAPGKKTKVVKPGVVAKTNLMKKLKNNASIYVYSGPGGVVGASNIKNATDSFSGYTSVDLQVLSAETSVSDDGNTTAYSITAGFSFLNKNIDVNAGRVDFHFVVTSGQIVEASYELCRSHIGDPYYQVMSLTPGQWCKWIYGYYPSEVYLR